MKTYFLLQKWLPKLAGHLYKIVKAIEHKRDR